MGRGSEETFFQRRHRDGQQENMFNIPNHQGNANQNHNEISSHTCQNGYCQKDKKKRCVGKDVEKRELLCTIGGNVNWCSHYRKQCGVSSKSKKQAYHITHLGTYPVGRSGRGALTHVPLKSPHIPTGRDGPCISRRK